MGGGAGRGRGESRQGGGEQTAVAHALVNTSYCPPDHPAWGGVGWREARGGGGVEGEGVESRGPNKCVVTRIKQHPLDDLQAFPSPPPQSAHMEEQGPQLLQLGQLFRCGIFLVTITTSSWLK